MAMSDNIEDVPGFCLFVDRIIRRIGKSVAWLNSLLVINILVQVILRYALGEGKIWLEELEWHLYGVCIMIGIAYGVSVDAHIRLDLLHQRFSQRKREYVEFFGTLFLILPLVTILFFHGASFVETAWRVNEMSAHPLGLPLRWIIKSVIPISMLLIALASVSRMVRSASFILNENKVSGK